MGTIIHIESDESPSRKKNTIIHIESDESPSRMKNNRRRSISSKNDKKNNNRRRSISSKKSSRHDKKIHSLNRKGYSEFGLEKGKKLLKKNYPAIQGQEREELSEELLKRGRRPSTKGHDDDEVPKRGRPSLKGHDNELPKKRRPSLKGHEEELPKKGRLSLKHSHDVRKHGEDARSISSYTTSSVSR